MAWEQYRNVINDLPLIAMLMAAYDGSVGPVRPEEFGLPRVLILVELPQMDEVGHNPVSVLEGGRTKWFIFFLG